jgi:PAS domain S-box-containing protein
MLERSGDAIVSWRFHGGVESWNRGAERLYGYGEAEVMGRPLHALLESRLPMAWSEIERRLRADGEWSGVLRQRTRQGRLIVVTTWLQLFRGDDGVERVLETGRDLSDRLRAELAEHRLEEARLHSLRAHLQDPELLLAADGSIVDANDPAVALYGHPRASLLGLHARDLCDASTPWTPVLAGPDGQAAEPSRHEAVHRRRDGTTFPVEVRSRGFVVDGQAFLHVICRDLIERRRAQEQEELFQSLVDQMDEGVITLDLDLRVRTWSRGATGLFGWTAHEATGRRLHALIRPDMTADEIQSLSARFGTGERVSITACRLRKDGTELTTASTVKALRDPAGRITGYLMVARDITALQAARRATEEAARQAHALTERTLTELAEALGKVRSLSGQGRPYPDPPADQPGAQ